MILSITKSIATLGERDPFTRVHSTKSIAALRVRDECDLLAQRASRRSESATPKRCDRHPEEMRQAPGHVAIMCVCRFLPQRFSTGRCPSISRRSPDRIHHFSTGSPHGV